MSALPTHPVPATGAHAALEWSVAYVGLPWAEKGDTREGVSCWGLPVLVYREIEAIVLPTYAEDFASSQERDEVAAVIAGATRAWPWTAVQPGYERDLDILVFRCAGTDLHVGIVCGSGRMLHVTSRQDSNIVGYRWGRWSARLSGIYRHAAMMEAGRGF